MTGMIGPDCAVMCNLIKNTNAHRHKRKAGMGARSPLPTSSFFSLFRLVVRLAKTCMLSSRGSPSDG